MPYLTSREKLFRASYLILFLLVAAFAIIRGHFKGADADNTAMIAVEYLVSLAVVYHCAIAHPGTILLSISMFWCIVNVFLFAYEVFPLLRSLSHIPEASTALLQSIILCSAAIVLHFTFFFLHYKLRQININLQIRLVLNEEPNLFSTWDASINAEDFVSKFRAAVQRWPKYEKGLTAEYKKRQHYFVKRTSP